MAVVIPPTGSGTATPTVASDLTIGEHYQFVKIVDATSGSTQPVSASTYGLSVDVARLQSVVTVANLPSTQTVSGTVSINASSVTVLNSVLTSQTTILNSLLTVNPGSASTWTVVPGTGATFTVNPSSMTVLNSVLTSQSTILNSLLTVGPGSASTWTIVPGTGAAFTVNPGSASTWTVVPGTGAVFTVGSHAVTNAGTFAVQASGDVATGANNTTNAVQIAVEAIAHGANPAAVTAGQRTKLYASREGIPFHIGGHPFVQSLETAFTGAQTDVAMITVGAGIKIIVTQAQVVADNANTAFPQCRMGLGTANTPTTTGVVLTHPGVPAGGGVSRGDGSGILHIGADGEDLRITCGAPTGGSLRFLVSYYTSAS